VKTQLLFGDHSKDPQSRILQTDSWPMV